MKAAPLTRLQDGLALCPFCNSAAKLEPMPGTNNNWWRVRCTNYHCGGTTYPQSDERATVDAWNLRSVNG